MTLEQESDFSTGALSRKRLLVVAVAAIAALTILRLFLSGTIELLPEEAYYWTYSQHPALGYFDHPPMVAWIIWLGTKIFGNTELGVRIGTIVLWLGTAGLLFLTGRIWFGEIAALISVVIFSLAPVFVGIGLIVTPDAPLLFFWMLTLYAISRALVTGRGIFWLLAGVGLGGALLSKYTAILLTISLLVFLLFSAKYRFWLRRPPLWMALVVALVVFSPVIIWNAQNQWASFLFQSTRTAGQQTNLPWDLGLFWVYQIAVLTPLLFILFIKAAGVGVQRGWMRREDAWNFAVSFAVPLFLVFVLASFKTGVHINWTAPAYLSWTFLAAAVWQQAISDPAPGRRKLWRVCTGITAVLCLAAILIGHMSIAWGVPRIFAYTRAGGWRSLAAQVKSARADLARETGQQPFILGADKYNIAAELGFYTGDPRECVNVYLLGLRALGFRYWVDLEEFKGRPAIAVLAKMRPDMVAELRASFDKVGEPVPIKIQSHGVRRRNAYLIPCYGYHGNPEKPVAADGEPADESGPQP